MLRVTCHPFLAPVGKLKEDVREMCQRPPEDVAWEQKMGPARDLLEWHVEQRQHDMGVGLLEAPHGGGVCAVGPGGECRRGDMMMASLEKPSAAFMF